MYERVEKPKENKSIAVANAGGQRKSVGKQGFGFVDNRSENITQRKLLEVREDGLQNKNLTPVLSTSSVKNNTMQRKSGGDKNHDAELTDIINTLKEILNEEDVQADPETFKEISHYIEKATEVLSGDDTQAKEALVEGARTGTSSTADADLVKDADSSAQMKTNSAAPVQRVVGVLLGIAAIGYGIYRIRQNRRRLARQAPDDGAILDIPTTRAEFGETLAYGGLTTRERTNEEIGEEVRRRTSHNHEILYQQLIRDGAPRDIADLVQGVRVDNSVTLDSSVCHDLTSYLVEARTRERPSLHNLRNITGATQVINYDLNSDDSLENALAGARPGTSVWLGSDGAGSGHSFTVIGTSGGHVIVADRQPANPIAALKYASTVEAEARLARNLNPTMTDLIDIEFSGRLVLHGYPPVSD